MRQPCWTASQVVIRNPSARAHCRAILTFTTRSLYCQSDPSCSTQATRTPQRVYRHPGPGQAESAIL
jgi:hypothetical protein